jgi:glycosyltransferase involved in cell wall biosynthesis
MKEKILSIIIPVYNEEKTILPLLEKIKTLEIPDIKKEIIVVDDASQDKTTKLLEKQDGIKLLKQPKNQGKGACFKAGLRKAQGDIIIIQDADLEYDPQDIKKCLQPILQGKAQVVYGSRELRKKNQKGKFIFFLGGKMVTWFCNLLYGSHLTDEATCYKCFQSKLIKSLIIEGNGFEWEPEITAKILKNGFLIKEVPIQYFPRQKGKKINYQDGFKAFWTLIKYRFKD